MEAYRRMTPGERLALTLKLSDEKFPILLSGTPEEVERRFELLRQYREEGNRRILEALARSCGREVESQPDKWDSTIEMRPDDPAVREIEEWL
jgi:hypothetical protein